MKGNISCDGGYVVPIDDTGLYYTWFAESETGDPLAPGTYTINASLTDRWQRTTNSSQTIDVVDPDDEPTPTATQDNGGDYLPSGYCTIACPWSCVGDGHCDSSCNLAACNYDGGDCQLPSPEPEEVLYGYLYIYTECTYMDQECVICTITADITGEDLTGGEYPVTNVVLKTNGQVLHDSGFISTALYDNSASLSANCGQTYNFELTVTNSIGLEGVVTNTIVAETSE